MEFSKVEFLANGSPKKVNSSQVEVQELRYLHMEALEVEFLANGSLKGR